MHNNQPKSQHAVADDRTNQRLQFLYCLRFFQKKALNGGLNVFEMRALYKLKQRIKELGIEFVKADLEQLPSLHKESYLQIMQKFSDRTGFLLEMQFTGDVDADLVLCQTLLTKIKEKPVKQITLVGYKASDVNVYEWLGREFAEPNQLIVLQPNVDEFGLVLAKYLIIFEKKLQEFITLRPEKPPLPLVKETPNSQDQRLHKDKFLLPFEMPLNIQSQIALQHKDDGLAERLAGQKVGTDVTYQVRYNKYDNGVGVFFNYQAKVWAKGNAI